VVLTINLYLASIDSDQIQNSFDQSRLTAAIHTDQTKEFTRIYRQLNFIENHFTGISFNNFLAIDRHIHSLVTAPPLALCNKPLAPEHKKEPIRTLFSQLSISYSGLEISKYRSTVRARC